MKIRMDFLGSILGKMIKGGVIALHDRDSFEKAQLEKMGTYDAYVTDTGKILGCQEMFTFSDCSDGMMSHCEKTFVLKNNKKSFAEHFRLYLLAATVEAANQNKHVPLTEMLQNGVELEIEAYSIKNIKADSSFEEILEACSKYLMNISSKEVLLYAVSKLKAAHGIGEAMQGPVHKSKSTRLSEAIGKEILKTHEEKVELFIRPQVRFYYIAAIIEAKLAGYIFSNVCDEIIAADALIAALGLTERKDFDEILKDVECYVLQNMATLDDSVAKAAPEILFLPLPQSIDEYYDNFKKNVQVFGAKFSEDSRIKLLKMFEDLLAHLIVYKFSEEEITAAFTICPTTGLDKLYEKAAHILSTLDLKKDLERAKIVGNFFVKNGQTSGLLKYLGLDTMLEFVDEGVLNVDELSASDLSFIAKPLAGNLPLDFKSCYNENPKFFAAFIRHMDSFVATDDDDYYTGLVAAVLEMEPLLLLNTHILNALAEDIDKLKAKLETHDYPPDALKTLTTKKFIKLVETVFRQDLERAMESGSLDSFRENPLLANFQAAVAQNLEAFKDPSLITKDNKDIILVLYSICTNEQYRAEIEDAIVLADKVSDKKPSVLVLIALISNIKFFEKFDEERAREILKVLNKSGNNKGTDMIVSNILKHESQYILSKEGLRKIFIDPNHMTTDDYSNSALFRMLDAADNKVVFWQNFTKNELEGLVKFFEENFEDYDKHPNLASPFGYIFTAQELLELEAINFIHKIALSDPGYIDGPIKTHIQYEFLKAGMDILCVDEDSVKSLCRHVYAQTGVNTRVQSFIEEHKVEFNSLKAAAKIETAAAQAEVEKIREVSEIDSAIAKAELDRIEKESEASAFLLEAPQREAKLRQEAQEVEAKLRQKAQDEMHKAALKAAKYTAIQEEVKAKQEEVKLRTEIKAGIKLKSTEELFADYCLCVEANEVYLEYEHLTNEQKENLALRVLADPAFAARALTAKVDARNNFKEPHILRAALDKSVPYSSVFYNLLLVSGKENVQYAIQKYKITTDLLSDQDYILHYLEHSIEDDRRLQLLFYKGAKDPIGVSADFMALSLLGLGFCAYKFYSNTAVAILGWESKMLAAGACGVCLIIHARDLYEYAQYRIARPDVAGLER